MVSKLFVKNFELKIFKNQEWKILILSKSFLTVCMEAEKVVEMVLKIGVLLTYFSILFNKSCEILEQAVLWS